MARPVAVRIVFLFNESKSFIYFREECTWVENDIRNGVSFGDVKRTAPIDDEFAILIQL